MRFVTTPIRFFLCITITLLAMAGCGDSSGKPDATVQGTVTIDGELVGRGIVTFYPDATGPVAYGSILKDGTYALRIGQGEKKESNNKIRSGKYTATVAVNMPSTTPMESEGGPPKPGSRINDAKFSDKTTSELKFVVKPGLNVINISVDRAQPVEEDGSEEESETDTDTASDGIDGATDTEAQAQEESKPKADSPESRPITEEKPESVESESSQAPPVKEVEEDTDSEAAQQESAQ